MRWTCVLFTAYLATSNASAFDYGGVVDRALKFGESVSQLASSSTDSVVGEAGKVEVGFSPNGAALPLILKVINSSKETIDVMAYSFTSADITRALLNAQKRGVRVRVLADHKHNTATNSAKYAQSAMSSLTTAGAEVRLTDEFAIFHDKVVLSDSLHVQTGSFNYSKAAAKSNSENVVVMWSAPDIAKEYSNHFESRWRKGKRFNGRP